MYAGVMYGIAAFLGIDSFVQYIIRGAIIVIAVGIDVRKYIEKK